MRDLLRRQAAETPELGDHMRLIGISHFERRLGPVHARIVRIRKRGMKPGQPAISFGSHPNHLAKDTRQMLPRDSCGGRQRLDRNDAAGPKNPSGQTGDIHGARAILRSRDLPQQNRFKFADARGFRREFVQSLRSAQHANAPQVIQAKTWSVNALPSTPVTAQAEPARRYAPAISCRSDSDAGPTPFIGPITSPRDSEA